MSKLLMVAVIGGILSFGGLSSYAQQQLPVPIPAVPAPPPPPLPNPLPSPSRFPRSSSITSPSLGPGASGSDVIALQLALERNGINPGPIDGQFGPMTGEAVREFQQLYDLPITGVAGPDTLDILGIIDGVEDADEIAITNPVGNEDIARPYVAAVIESPDQLRDVRRVFNNAAVDTVRQGDFISIGRYERRSEAAERVREARRSGFDARILYKR